MILCILSALSQKPFYFFFFFLFTRSHRGVHVISQGTCNVANANSVLTSLDDWVI